MTTRSADPKERLLEAIVDHVPFEGWSAAAFTAAQEDTGIDATVARAVCPRGAVDLAVAYHQQGDAFMLRCLKDENLNDLRFRDRIALAVRLRLEAVPDKEIVRRGTVLFALPQHAAEGSKLIWGTSDAIWNALGDTSDDVNWYTKRASLSGVYGATVLYWLGDTSADNVDTIEFLDRRIENVMQIEKLKAQVRDSPTLSKLMAGPNWLMSHVKAPNPFSKSNFPGSWNRPRG